MSKKRKNANREEEFEFEPIPKHLVVAHIKKQEKRLIIVLENSQLETVKVGNNFELLNCDDHANILRKSERDPGSCRPDITHQSLLMLMDSPLNRAGLLQVYIHTEKNVLIEINPQTRIPRTFKRFSGLMGVKKITMSFSSKKVQNCRDLVPKEEVPIVLIVGAMAHGKIEVDYSEDVISISNYPLSAALTCAKLCSAFEESWNIV
ncbi:Ribosomal RNA small subunit methyltransferase NEP1 [Eumeta japonica]|uniref:Ribosomal RNA small subunit methyltransferase NEP1 n=1 Tax=Eumeta variegata TaxID=151549 RepID=A0A4C1XW98_EUMVA|nr:Ribosomal RNA small subunit methyltransferase NEP1 [Eumeta japonica]